MLGSPILYLKAMRILMFQLSGFYCKTLNFKGALRNKQNSLFFLEIHARKTEEAPSLHVQNTVQSPKPWDGLQRVALTLWILLLCTAKRNPFN